MNILVLSSSNVGTKSRITANYVVQHIQEQYPLEKVDLIDLKEYNMTFSDGRNYLDYDGDNRIIAEGVMDADVLFIVTPIFQASIPATLKNVFDGKLQYQMHNFFKKFNHINDLTIKPDILMNIAFSNSISNLYFHCCH